MLSLKISLRFVKKSWFLTSLIILVVIVGVGVQFFISNLGNILSNMITEQATNYQDHILLTTNDKNMNNNFRNELISDIDDINYALFRSETKGVIKGDNLEPLDFIIYFVDNLNNNDDYLNFFGLAVENNIVQGRANNTSANEIMLDDYFARKNNIKLGDDITYAINNTFENKSFKVVGTFDIGVYRSSRNYSYLSSNHLDSNVNLNHTLAIQVKHIQNTSNTESSIKSLISNYDLDYELVTWRNNYPEVDLLDLAQRTIVFVIQLLISIAVFVVILSVLGFYIQQKNKEIGILKAMGINNFNVLAIFISITAFLTLVGSTIGLIAGTYTMKSYHNYMVYNDGSHRFSYEITFMNYFVSFVLVLAAVLIATFTAINKTKKESIINLIKI